MSSHSPSHSWAGAVLASDCSRCSVLRHTAPRGEEPVCREGAVRGMETVLYKSPSLSCLHPYYSDLVDGGKEAWEKLPVPVTGLQLGEGT